MAIWEKLFSKITFKDYPDTSTPLNASNMNALSNAIDGIDDRVVGLNSNLEQTNSNLEQTKSKLEWKLLGVYNAQSGVNVRDVDAREFFVVHSKDTLCIEHQFPANMGNAEMYGGFYNSASSFIGESLTYVDGVIYGRVFVASGVDHSATAVIQVYYR